MKLLEFYYKGVKTLEKLKDIPLLFIRLALAYGFYGPAKMKWSDMNSIIEWFKGMNVPAPALNAYLAATTEAAGVVLLVLGLGTRIVSIPLIVIMLVAIKTVHWSNGFEAGENGFEIPLYYLIMLLLLLIYGPGRISLDKLINRKFSKGQQVSYVN
jgi:putative oxidoreductase